VGAKPLMPLHPRGDEQEDVALPMPREFRRTYEPCPSNVEPQLTLKTFGASVATSLQSRPRMLGLLAAVALAAVVVGLSTSGRQANSASTELPTQSMQEMGARPEVCLGLKDSGQLAKLRCRCASMAASEAVGCYLNSASEMNSNELQSLECKSEIEGSAECHTAMFHTKKILSLGTRSPGEVGWASTIDYISQVLTSLGWHVEYDQFTAETPLGSKPMKSVIASFSPQGGDCILDLAAHLDSKFFQDFAFLGATDSAAPMGMMLSLAERLTPLLQRKLSADGALPCFRMLFFDGEEAFVRWTATGEGGAGAGAGGGETRRKFLRSSGKGKEQRKHSKRSACVYLAAADSIYGSRHLAAAWSNTRGPFQLAYGSTRISSMRTLMLLDLLVRPRSCSRR